MNGSVVHFELPADNMGRAQEFYRETFGWNINAIPEMGYALVYTGESEENGTPSEPGRINGGMLQRQEPITTPLVTIGVDDVEAALIAIEKNGGKTVREAQPVGAMGIAAYFADSEGNVVGLWQPLDQ